MDLAKHRQAVQIEHPGCFSQRDFATLGPLAVRVDRDAVRVAEAPPGDFEIGQVIARPSLNGLAALSGTYHL